MRGLSRSLFAGMRKARLSRVGVRYAPGISSDARLFVPASAVTHISLPTSSSPLSNNINYPSFAWIINICGLEGTRTPYLCNANAALYQMSYKPKGHIIKQTGPLHSASFHSSGCRELVTVAKLFTLVSLDEKQAPRPGLVMRRFTPHITPAFNSRRKPSSWLAALRLVSLVGVPGIEPGLHAPHACVLPLYYTPKNTIAIV